MSAKWAMSARWASIGLWAIHPLTLIGLRLLYLCLLVQPALGEEPYPQVLAHRGYASIAPENSRAAIEQAIADHCDWVELDVRLTQDQEHVIFHNETVDGRTAGVGPVAQLSLAQLQHLDSGTWFAPRFQDQRMLSLAECLALCESRIGLVLDCKSIAPERFVEQVLAQYRDSDVRARRLMIYAPPDVLQRLRELSDGQLPLMMKWHPTRGSPDLIQQLRPVCVEIDSDLIDARICETFHAQQIRVEAKMLGAHDRRSEWERMVRYGVDLLQTDLPEEVLAVSRLQRVPRAKRATQLACHRGASRYAPENTRAAWLKALALEADYVEIDVRTTADGHCYLLHDAKLDRTTDRRGLISAITRSELVNADAGSWFGVPFRGEPLPELDAFLAEFAAHSDQQLYFDAKHITPERLLTSIRRHQLIDRTIVYQSPDYLQRLSELEPKLRTLGPYPAPSAWTNYTERQWFPSALDVAWELITPELVQQCHDRRLQVFSDAPGSATESDYRRAMACGVDCIQTDYPLRLLNAFVPE